MTQMAGSQYPQSKTKLEKLHLGDSQILPEIIYKQASPNADIDIEKQSSHESTAYLYFSLCDFVAVWNIPSCLPQRDKLKICLKYRPVSLRVHPGKTRRKKITPRDVSRAFSGCTLLALDSTWGKALKISKPKAVSGTSLLLCSGQHCCIFVPSFRQIRNLEAPA